MTSTHRPTLRLRLAAAAAACAAVSALGAAPAGAAGSIPFSDPNATAQLGFCDRAGHEITSGKIGDAPFAWTAVSSAPAPKGYGAPRGRASLFVYQPIKDVDPGDWSGKQMTAASQFTSTSHPMARATVLDPALVDFSSVFPPHWDGLVQFRMFFSAPLATQVSRPYPAAVVRITGSTWTLVSGGHPDCKAGRAVSNETVSLPKSVFDQAKPRSTPGITASPSGSSSGRSRAGTASGAPASAASGTAGGHAVDAARSTSTAAGGSSAWWWFAAAAALAAGGGVALVRRRRST